MKKFVLILVAGVTLSFGAQAEGPQASCRQSLLENYQRVPTSMIRVCTAVRNQYAAQAVKKYAKTFSSLPVEILSVLTAVGTADQLACVESVADNYSRVSAEFIARACLNFIALDY